MKFQFYIRWENYSPLVCVCKLWKEKKPIREEFKMFAVPSKCIVRIARWKSRYVFQEKGFSRAYADTRKKTAGQKIRTEFPRYMAAINQLARDSQRAAAYNDTMRAEKTVPRHDRVCHYCVTYMPLRGRARRIRMRLHRGRGCYKTCAKSDLPGTSRMQGYDRENPPVRLLIEH